jgi:hypothetical protein
MQDTYNINPTSIVPEMREDWEGVVWNQAAPLSVSYCRPEGSDHRPPTLCKLLYDDFNLYGIFRVEDQYVRCIRTAFQADVWKDSCVELFVQPQGACGYYNFEFNCGGALLASYVTNPARVNGRLQEFVPLTEADNGRILRIASLPAVVEPEILQPLVWYLEFSIPFSVLAKYAGPLGAVLGQIWRANFYKCGNETSHPHWLSWMPLAERNFHDPSSFGKLKFIPNTLHHDYRYQSE